MRHLGLCDSLQNPTPDVKKVRCQTQVTGWRSVVCGWVISLREEFDETHQYNGSHFNSECATRFYCRLTLGLRAQRIPIKIGQATGQICSMLYKQCASFFFFKKNQHDTKQSSTFFKTRMQHELCIYRMKSVDFWKKHNHRMNSHRGFFFVSVKGVADVSSLTRTLWLICIWGGCVVYHHPQELNFLLSGENVF